MLEEAYEHLLQNTYMTRKLTGPNERPLSCLAAHIASRGKSLVGKRADYSGTAQLVVDGTLAEGECRLPRTMALELFKPFLYGALERAGWVTAIKAAKQMVEGAIDALHEGGTTPSATVLQLLAEVTNDHPVVVAGEDRVVGRRVTLWDHPAIAVGPSTATLLPDRSVAVHVPLTDEARAQCANIPDDAHPVERDPSGWLAKLLLGTTEPWVLARAALDGEVDPLDDPVVRLALGLRPD